MNTAMRFSLALLAVVSIVSQAAYAGDCSRSSSYSSSSSNGANTFALSSGSAYVITSHTSPTVFAASPYVMTAQPTVFTVSGNSQSNTSAQLGTFERTLLTGLIELLTSNLGRQNPPARDTETPASNTGLQQQVNDIRKDVQDIKQFLGMPAEPGSPSSGASPGNSSLPNSPLGAAAAAASPTPQSDAIASIQQRVDAIKKLREIDQQHMTQLNQDMAALKAQMTQLEESIKQLQSR